MKKILFILSALAALSPFVSACGVHDESEIVGGGIMGFGFFGGIVSTLVVVALVLGIVLLGRKLRE